MVNGGVGMVSVACATQGSREEGEKFGDQWEVVGLVCKASNELKGGCVYLVKEL